MLLNFAILQQASLGFAVASSSPQPQPQPVLPSATFIDYIFQFPDQGAFLRDPVIQQFLSQASATQPGVQLLIYNPVEGSPLANSAVALLGFWALMTLNGLSIPALSTHPNIQIVSNRTKMFAGQPSVISTKIDVSHINIIINVSSVYVRDGLTLM